MNVSVDKLLQPCTSYSRTGKMTEAFAPSNIRVKAATNKGGVDYSKSLAANELGSEEPGGSFLCSSPRLHPSVTQKAEYVSRQEMETAFRLSVKNVFESHVATRTTQTNARPLMTDADWAAMKAALREANRKKPQQPSSSFLAVSRSRAGGASSTASNPPVGHYRPKFDVVEESPPRVRITKRASSPRQTRHRHPSQLLQTSSAHGVVDGAASLRESTASPALQPSPDLSPGGQQGGRSRVSSPAGASTLVASLNGIKSQSPDGALQGKRAPTPTWPFASSSPGHVLQVNRSWSVEPDPTRRVNATLVERRSGGSKANLNLALAPGRKGIGDSVVLKDIFYNHSQSEHTPTYKFSVAPGRERIASLPRTAADVPRNVSSDSQPPNVDLDQTKFKRQPVLVDFSKSSQRHPSRKRVVVEGGCPSPTDMVGDEGDETPSFSRHGVVSPDFRKFIPRPALQGRPTTDLVYDVRYDAVDKHHTTAFIAEPTVTTNKREMDDAHQSVYNPNDLLLHPTVVRNISLDSYVTRDKRERCGREGATQLSEAQHAFYDVDAASTSLHRVHGALDISRQVSRDQRTEVTSPKRACVDTVYDTNSEGRLPGLRRGMVEMSKMVDRERRSHSSLR